MSDRAGIFDEPDFDVSAFKPQPPKEKISREKVREVSESAQFRSREPEPKKARREARRYRTGRDTQFNIKADLRVIEDFYRLTEEEGWVLGETLEQAVNALKNEIAARKGRGA